MELIWSYSSHANRYVLHEYYILYRIKLILSRAAIPVSAIPHFNYTAGSNAGKSLFFLYKHLLIIYSCSTMVGYPCILGNAENKLFMGRTLQPRNYNRLPHYPPCCISRSQWYGISTLQWIFMCLQRALLLITWEMRWRAWTLLTAMTLLCCLAIWTTATSMAIKQCMCSITCLILINHTISATWGAHFSSSVFYVSVQVSGMYFYDKVGKYNIYATDTLGMCQ